jgi:hypothetical protein
MTNKLSSALCSAICLGSLSLAGCGGGNDTATTDPAGGVREEILRGGGGKARTLFDTTVRFDCTGTIVWSVTMAGAFQSATIRVYAMPGVSPVGPFAGDQTPRTTTALPTTFDGSLTGLDGAQLYNVQFRRFSGGEGKIDEEVWVPTGACQP